MKVHVLIALQDSMALLPRMIDPHRAIAGEEAVVLKLSVDITELIVPDLLSVAAAMASGSIGDASTNKDESVVPSIALSVALDAPGHGRIQAWQQECIDAANS